MNPANSDAPADALVAVLVDCDNAPTEALPYALRVVAQFGRVVVRRGYGNHHALGSRWQEPLVRFAFTPCLQYQYANGKNTADIALALDAMETLFDQRASAFCIVTSDSDFAYLCRKLRERGATVYIVGESKTPDALRNACDQFFEYAPAEAASRESSASPSSPPSTGAAPPAVALKAGVKLRPRVVVEAVSLLAADTAEGKVSVGALGSYLKRTNPDFSPKTYGHSGLLDMIKTYNLLEPRQEPGGHWTVRLAKSRDAGAPTPAP